MRLKIAKSGDSLMAGSQQLCNYITPGFLAPALTADRNGFLWSLGDGGGAHWPRGAATDSAGRRRIAFQLACDPGHRIFFEQSGAGAQHQELVLGELGIEVPVEVLRGL